MADFDPNDPTTWPPDANSLLGALIPQNPGGGFSSLLGAMPGTASPGLSLAFGGGQMPGVASPGLDLASPYGGTALAPMPTPAAAMPGTALAAGAAPAGQYPSSQAPFVQSGPDERGQIYNSSDPEGNLRELYSPRNPDFWDRYRRTAQEATEGINRMPFVFGGPDHSWDSLSQMRNNNASLAAMDPAQIFAQFYKGGAAPAAASTGGAPQAPTTDPNTLAELFGAGAFGGLGGLGGIFSAPGTGSRGG